MLRILQRMDKMMTLFRRLKRSGLLRGFGWETDLDNDATNVPIDESEEQAEEHEDELEDEEVSGSPPDISEFDVQFPTRSGACSVF